MTDLKKIAFVTKKKIPRKKIRRRLYEKVLDEYSKDNWRILQGGESRVLEYGALVEKEVRKQIKKKLK